MLSAIPALPVKNVEKSLSFYGDKLAFGLVHKQDNFAIFRRDKVEIHLWAAVDSSWKKRDVSAKPVISGAESFIAGTASCRVEVNGVDELHDELQPLGILHPNGQLEDKEYGLREFSVLDPDNNLITFFQISSLV